MSTIPTTTTDSIYYNGNSIPLINTAMSPEPGPEPEPTPTDNAIPLQFYQGFVYSNKTYIANTTGPFETTNQTSRYTLSKPVTFDSTENFNPYTTTISANKNQYNDSTVCLKDTANTTAGTSIWFIDQTENGYSWSTYLEENKKAIEFGGDNTGGIGVYGIDLNYCILSKTVTIPEEFSQPILTTPKLKFYAFYWYAGEELLYPSQFKQNQYPKYPNASKKLIINLSMTPVAIRTPWQLTMFSLDSPTQNMIYGYSIISNNTIQGNGYDKNLVKICLDDPDKYEDKTKIPGLEYLCIGGAGKYQIRFHNLCMSDIFNGFAI